MQKKHKKKIWIILSVIIILIGGMGMLLYKPEIINNNLINPIYSSFFDKLSIPVSSDYYTGEYKVLSKSGNESLYDVTITKDEKTGNSLICLEAGWDEKEVEVYKGDNKGEGGILDYKYTYQAPDILSFYKTEELIKQTDLIKTKASQLSATSPTNPNKFCYEANPEKDFYLKFGDNSVVVLQNSQVTGGNLVNITAEVNFTHLNISTSAPYNNLIGYWNFDAVEQVAWDNKTIYDFSSNNRNGALEGTAVVNSNGCLFGNCMQLDGIDVVQDPKLDLENKWTQSGTNNMVLMAWVRPNNAPTDQRIITSADECLIRFNGNTLEFILNSFTNPDRVVSASKKSLTNWQHVTGRYDKATNNMSLFYNGVHVNSSVPAGAYGTCATWNIGSKTGLSAGNFNGSIDEVMVFNGTLTDAQILAIYNNQSSRFLATGTQDIVNQSYMNISTGNNRVNVTTYIENNLGSSINLSVGYYDASETWAYATPQVVSSGAVQTFTITDTSTNLTLNYTFFAGNSTNPFYSPIIKSNITFDIWNEAVAGADNIYPQFSDYYDNNATLLDSGTGYFHVVVKNTNGTVILYINNTHTFATLGCQDEPGFYVEPDFYTCTSIGDEGACLEQSNCNWDGACQTVTYPFCSYFGSQATCEGSSQADVCTWGFGTSYEFTNAGTYIYNWTSYGNGTNHLLNISDNRYYLVNSSDTIWSNCWTKTGNILYIPKGCVFQLNKGSIYEI